MANEFKIGDRVTIKDGELYNKEFTDIGTIIAINGGEEHGLPTYEVIFDASKVKQVFTSSCLENAKVAVYNVPTISVGGKVLIESVVKKIVQDDVGTVYYVAITDADKELYVIKIAPEQMTNYIFDYGDKVHVVNSQKYRRGIIVGINSSFYKSTYCIAFNNGQAIKWYADKEIGYGWEEEDFEDANTSV